MLKEEIKFKHNSDSLPTAMGFSESIDNRCREIIHFAAFSNYFIKEDFFDEEEEAPDNLTTVTGVLEKALGLCTTKEEEMYTLFCFKTIHKMSGQALGAYMSLQEADEKERKKMQMLIELSELKANFDEDEERSNLLTAKDMFKRIDLAKDNLYNFDNYYNAVSNDSKN